MLKEMETWVYAVIRQIGGNVKKRWLAVLGALIFSCMSCSGENTAAPEVSGSAAPTSEISNDADETKESESEKKEDGYRVGSVVSDAYVDPDKITTPSPEEIKAQGYEYDYDTLEYELVWSDEFDYEGAPDETKWGYDIGGSGWGNHELQYYTEGDNATVKDGYLIIEARKEEYGQKDYTSARLITKGKGDWLYGKIEVRAKLPSGKGTWPAIWMLPTDWAYGSWPASGEIDIMEHVGYDQGRVHASVHTQSFYHSIGTQKTGTVYSGDVSEEFHVYTLEWLPDQILVSMDGEEIFSFHPSKYRYQPTYKEWPFDKRMHLLLNLAIGGDWGGAMGVDDDICPCQLLVDYVRVYQSETINELVRE